jgi:serine/arginine repetitive matrix protein 2
MSLLPPPNSSRAPSPVPTIRLIEATPAQSSSVPDASTPSLPSPLAPKKPAPRKRLALHRSKLNILGANKEREKGRDLSDIARRVGDDSTPSSLRGGFEIFVDSTYDPEIGELLVVKKKKSRAPLDGMQWGNALGEVTNVPSAQQEKPPTLKVKEDKWWAIGRGRKDSKEKKEKERDKSKSRANRMW